MATGPAAKISPFPYFAAVEYTQLRVLGTGTETAGFAVGGMLSAVIWLVEETLVVVVLSGKSQITKILGGAVLGSGAVSQGQWFTEFRTIVVAACSKTHIPHTPVAP
jgi:hypothetical protein